MTDPTKPTFCIIGGGRAGASLAFYLIRRGYPVNSLVERNPDRLSYLRKEFNWEFLTDRLDSEAITASTVVLLTVHDGQIADLAQILAGKNLNWKKKVAAHTSGALPAAVLKPLKDNGAAICSVHPVYSFSADPRENHLEKDIWFNLEGDLPALQLFEDIFRYTRNRSFRVTESQKKGIHIASVFYANFYVALAEGSRRILAGTGLSEQDIFKMLNPLLSSAIEQITEHGPARGLTGPVKRGDGETIRAHLTYLGENHPELLELYRQLSRELLSVSGLQGNTRVQLEKILGASGEQ